MYVTQANAITKARIILCTDYMHSTRNREEKKAYTMESAKVALNTEKPSRILRANILRQFIGTIILV